MTKVINESYETRTFSEIWHSLGTTSRLQLELRDDIMSKTYVARQTVYNWATNKTKPQECLQRIVAGSIKRVLGISVNHRVLFP